jgi:DNA segregation ATPase FtsK/SpoIIIE, S-DNA-T family
MARRKKKKSKTKLKKKTIMSVIAVIFLMLGFITLFGFLRQGEVLIRLNDIFIKYFGLAALFLPPIFLILALLVSSISTPLQQPTIIIGALITFISILGIGRAGECGIWLWEQVSYLITPLGAATIFAGGFLIGLVVMFNSSLKELIEWWGKILKTVKKYILGDQKKEKPLFVGEKEEKEKKEPKEEPQISPLAGKRPAPAVEKPSSEDIPISPFTSAGEAADWKYPPLNILRDDLDSEANRGNVNANANTIEETLESFGITARVKEVNKGPAVTQYALKVALGTKLSKITSRTEDLALALAAPTGQIRIQAPIPGRSLVGIEVPNKSSAIVSLREMLDSEEMENAEPTISIPLGLDVSNKIRVIDVRKMPHMLIAGQTGSGKSVLLSSIISTLLFRTTPDELRLILVDPKRVELTRFDNIPHLLTPVLTDPKKVVSALKWAIKEMDRRYEVLAKKGVRNLEFYNQAVEEDEKIPYVLIIIDELADIMLFAPSEVEDKICRLAQMARATGIHLLLATQRPSVDVITGLIKANIPSRISFAVASNADSRVILDMPGAEKLLGKGDMLFIPPDQAKPSRIQGPYVSDPEINELIEFLKDQGETNYQKEVIKQPVPVSESTVLIDGEERDELFDEAKQLVIAADKGSASLLQRKLHVGYARAARILDQLHAAGVVGPAQGSKARKVIKA